MSNLPLYVGLDYHQKIIQVCVMDQFRKILTNQSVDNDPEAVMRVVAPFGGNVHAAIEASTGAPEFAEQRKQVKLRIRALLRNHRIVCPHSPWTIA